MEPIKTLVEPLGHAFQLSKIERIWSAGERGTALARRRVELFDPVNLVAYSPMEYEMRSLVPILTSPTDDEIANMLVKFVRDEFGSDRSMSSDRLVAVPRVVDTKIVTLSDLNDYLVEAEEQFIYGPYSRGLAAKTNSVGEYMYEVIADGRLGHLANRTNIDASDFTRRVNASTDKQERLMFSFLGFPFKDQNPLRTAAPPSHPDFAEIGMLIQLHLQALSFFQKHPFGVDFVILSDGRLYADIFGVSVTDATQYIGKIRLIRNALNLQGSIHILDLAEMVQRLDEVEENFFGALRTRVVKLLEDSRYIEQNAAIASAMNNLAVGMRRNINSKAELRDLDWKSMANLIYQLKELPADPKIVRIGKELDERSRRAAREYAAINIALRYHDLVMRVLANPLRATIHPKPGQVAVPRSGTAYPWNGVAIWEPRLSFPLRIQSRMLGELGMGDHPWSAGYLPGDLAPAFYTRLPN